MVWEFAILPEMFCSANDCACRPDTAVVNASKIPMTLPLQLDPQLDERPGHDRRPFAAHLAASAMPFVLSLYLNGLCRWRCCTPGPDMPTYRQILPSCTFHVWRRQAPRRLVTDKFA